MIFLKHKFDCIVSSCLKICQYFLIIPDYLLKSDLSCLKFCYTSTVTFFQLWKHNMLVLMFFSPPGIHFFTPCPPAPSSSNNSYSSFKSLLRCYFLQEGTFKEGPKSGLYVLPPWSHGILCFSHRITSILHYNYSVSSVDCKVQKNMNFILSTIKSLVPTTLQ